MRVFRETTGKTECGSCNNKLRYCRGVDILLFLNLKVCVRNLSLNSLIGSFFPPPADCAKLAYDALFDPRANPDRRTTAEHLVCVSQFEHHLTPSVSSRPYLTNRTCRRVGSPAYSDDRHTATSLARASPCTGPAAAASLGCARPLSPLTLQPSNRPHDCNVGDEGGGRGGLKRLKDINLISLFVILEKIERVLRHFGLSVQQERKRRSTVADVMFCAAGG